MPSPPAALIDWRVSWLLVIGLGVFVGISAPAADMKDIDAFYTPIRVEQAALAPDGRHVAFSIRNQRTLEVHIFDTERPGDKSVLILDRDRNATTRILNWISADQLLAVSSTPVVVVTDPTARSVTPVNLTHLYHQSVGDEGNSKRPNARIIQAPDDPACLLFESNVLVPTDDAPADPNESEDAATAEPASSGGIPDRPWLLEMHRLNVLTGEVRRVMDYDVEKDTSPGSTIVDRSGKPRVVYRYRAEPPHFAYRDSEEKTSGLSKLRALFADAGWHDLNGVLQERSTFSFVLEPKNMLQERTIPLGFDSDPNVLFYASNLRRDTYGIYSANLRTGKRAELAIEEAGVDLVDPESPWLNPPLIFDRHRKTLVGVSVRALEPSIRWLDPEIEAIQHEIENKFPSRRVQLLEWDSQRERVLALIGSLGDPGRYFIYQRLDGRCVEYLRRAPSIPRNELNPTESFAFTTPGGVRMTGYLTLPRAQGKVLPPVVVSLHDGPWQRVEAGYDRDSQALAAMGFAVVKINYRGSAGFGIAHRESIRTSLDRGPIDDVLATVEWIRTHYRIDARRVGLLGEGYGGYLALRALQLHPEAFQSAVAINGLTTPLDLWSSLEPEIAMDAPSADTPPPKAEFKRPGVRLGPDPLRALALWLVSRQSGLGSIAVTSNLKQLNKPVFLLHDPDNREAPFLSISNLRASLRRQGHAPEYQKLSADFTVPGSSERARVYLRIGEFFNLTLYDFKVKIGEAREKEGP